MAADGNWCTPPDSPSKARHKVISSSYEHAISDNDWYWDWHHDIREVECDEPTPSVELVNKLRAQDCVSSSLPVEIGRSPPIPTPPREQDQPPPHLRSSEPTYRDKTSRLQEDSGLGVGASKDMDDLPSMSGKSVLVAASNPTVVGFTPAYQTSYETTQISSLPGTTSLDDSVVLSPPTSNSKTPKSIEDVGDKLTNYAPVDPTKHSGNQTGAEEDNVGCLNYLTTSFGEVTTVKSQETDDSIVSDLVRGQMISLNFCLFMFD